MKKQNLFVLFIIFLTSSAFMLCREISSLDELWNYNFARNICNSLLPYKDFNIIQMPLYPALVAVFLKLIANELIISRLVATLIFTCTLFLAYKILQMIVKNKWLPLLSVFGILMIYKADFWGDYNFAVLLITVLIIFLELRNNKKNDKILHLDMKYDFFVGIIVGLSIITKQTTGLLLAFTFVIYKWILIRNKKDFILAFKISFIRGIGILLPIIAFIIYLLATNSINAFIDYSIKGISTFENSFPYEELLKHPDIKTIFKVCGILVPIFFVINTIVFFLPKLPIEDKRNLFVLLIFSLQNMIVIYPLCDVVHFIIGMLPITITTFYVISLLICRFMKDWLNRIIEIITVFCILVISLYSMCKLCEYVYNQFVLPNEFNNRLTHFYGIPVSEGVYNQNIILRDYIIEQNEQGKDVYILHIEAVLTMIILDKYNKNYDMLLEGNLGSKGEQRIIEDIESKENAIFLIEKTRSRNRQSTENVRQFIQDNYEEIGTVSNYSAFTKPE